MSSVKPGHRDPTDGPRRRHRLGIHLSIAGGIHHAAAQAIRLRCDTVQVFVKNQRQWRTSPLNPADVERWHELCRTPAFGPPVAHATYLINLASPDPRLLIRSRGAFAEELRRCDVLGIPYLVIHPGSATNGKIGPGLARVAKSLNRVLSKNPHLRTTPLLETTSGAGTTLGRSFAELGEIIGQTEHAWRPGICIDTCHVFAAGYDIRSPEGFASMVAEVAREVGLEHVRCWHLNDSLAPCGSHRDRHAHIGQGELGLAAFRNLLNDERFLGTPMILETPKGADARGRDWDVVNLARLRRLAATRQKRGHAHRHGEQKRE